MLKSKMFNKSKKQNKNKGFSLVEMLVAVGIFMSIMTISISSLISIIGANKRAQAIKSTIDSVNFAIEIMSKDMRMGTNYKCLLSDNSFSKICPAEGSMGVQYTNNAGATTTYLFSNAERTLKRIEGTAPYVYLISPDANVKITDMKFYIIGTEHELDVDVTTRTQPRAIITTSGLISVKGSSDTEFNLQSNISQRARR